MAIDKVIDSAQLEANLTAIADAIREKGGTTDTLAFPDGFVDAVGAIQADSGEAVDIFGMLNSNTLEVIETYSDNPIVTGWARSIAAKRINMPNCPGMSATNIWYFCNGGGLEEINMPKAVTLGSGCFTGQPKIETVSFPSLAQMGSQNFKGNTLLRTARFGRETLDTYSGSLAAITFDGCSALETLILSATDRIWNLANINALNGTLIASGTGYVYVPSVLAEEYKAATNWVTYADQIRAIEDYPEITGG